MIAGGARLQPFALERFFAQYEFTARYLLCPSDPEPLSVRELFALEPAAKEDFARLSLGYVDSRGGPALRRAIAGPYRQTGPERILVHSGTEEPIFTVMNALLEPGDHLIVQFPAYQSQYSIAESIGAHVTRWNSDLDREGAPDLEELPRLIRAETRVIVVTTPNNPTGYPFDRAQLESVVELARERGLWLVVDEVYRGTEREAERLPAICDLYERGVSLGGLAKAYGLAGLRIGWIATQDERLLDRAATIKDYLTICNSAPSEFLAAVALRHNEQLTERVRRITAANLDKLDEFFARRSDLFAWTRPRAGTTAFPRYLGGSSDAFCRRAVEEAGVLLLPSRIFDAGDAHLRIGYGRTNLGEALAALDAFIERST
ncbi:MAG TPA: aminotransferase class I/II-fold pyridoxal phosphate-dependent enzyme [Candidatus Cybelea sp.]|jgi:aspartate/methionine/tyrosine aminotransferase|nr:aminotransferase class I/II-fold pyridoxal phosphate-dependent enzyme [Candidatus Cybelea sp.]